MGDPAGVGPEVCLHLLQNATVTEICVPIIFGDAAVLEQSAGQCGLAKPEKYIGGLSEADGACVLDIGAIGLEDFETGTVNAATGRAGFAFVENAIDAALGGQVACVTTGFNSPIASMILASIVFSTGRRLVGSSKIEIFRCVRFCWYRRFLSAVMSASNLPSARSSKSPLVMPAHPAVCTVTTSCPANALAKSCGKFSSSRIFITAGQLKKCFGVGALHGWELLDKLIEAQAIIEVVQRRLRGHAGSAKNQPPAEDGGIRMHGALGECDHRCKIAQGTAECEL